MAIQTKIKKFLVKCKKPFSCLSKIKKNKRESITPSTVTTTTINTTKEEIIATTKEIKVNIQENEKTEHQFILPKEIKPQPQTQTQQQLQQQQPQQQQQQQQQLHSISTTKNTYKRYSINNIFNKSKFTPIISSVAPSLIHPVAIKLNVGGTIYMTTQQTLCTYPSYLSELFFLFRSPNSPPSSTYSSQSPWPEELFIDRDGELFIHILSFLRNGTLPYSIPLSILQKLEYEARFYGIKPLQTLISHRIQIHTSSPKYKVIPIERLSNEEYDFEDDSENVEINAITSSGVGLTRSNLSAYSAYSLPQHQDIPDNMSLSSSSSSSGDLSEEVPIIYNPCNTTLNSCHTATPTTNYTTPITRTPKSSTSTTNYTAQNNYYLSSAASPNYKPNYEVISITKIPVALNNNNYNFDNFDQINYEDFHAKELATFVVLQRKDD